MLTATITHDDGMVEEKSFELIVYGLPSYDVASFDDYTIDDINSLNLGETPEYQTNENGNIQSNYPANRSQAFFGISIDSIKKM